MAKRGRPRKYSKKFILELAKELEEYIAKNDIPIVAEFAYKHGLYKQFFYDHEEFSDLIKIAVTKKEANLERKALEGKIDKVMAMFSLKQLGWSDKQDVNVKAQVEQKYVAEFEGLEDESQEN